MFSNALREIVTQGLNHITQGPPKMTWEPPEHKNALKRTLRDKNPRPKSPPPGTLKRDLEASEHNNFLKRALRDKIQGLNHTHTHTHRHTGTTKSDLGASEQKMLLNEL